VIEWLIEETRGMPLEERTAVLSDTFARLSDDEYERHVRTNWRGIWARPEQLMPDGEWRTWLIMGGRGSGKTRPCVEAVREVSERDPHAVIALIGPTASDVRKVMIEGESGLMSVFPADRKPVYKPSVREIRFPSGALGLTYSAEEPQRLRGPQHSFAYLDEIAAYPDLKELWDLMIPGLRLGRNPQRICSTTPKPIRFLHDLIADPFTRTTRMRTRDNWMNLPQSTLDEFDRLYAGTRIGRQELEGELLEEAEGALWHRAQLDDLRVRSHPELKRTCVAIDPSVTSGPESDECGIIVCGLGVDDQGYPLQDSSGRFTPDEWISRAVAAFDFWKADKIIGEANNGGDLIESLLRTQRRNIPYEKVHASRGKLTRAEPVAALYEQKKVHHVGAFPKLEDEQTNYVAGVTKSPNRMDALVWGLSYLMIKRQLVGRFA
jgi:phage terminase large subunit-like protein